MRLEEGLDERDLLAIVVRGHDLRLDACGVRVEDLADGARAVGQLGDFEAGQGPGTRRAELRADGLAATLEQPSVAGGGDSVRAPPIDLDHEVHARVGRVSESRAAAARRS